MERKGLVLAGMVGIAAIALGTAGVVFSNVVVRPKRRSLASTLEEQLEHGYLSKDAYDALKSEDFEVISQFGYPLRGQWFCPEEKDSDKAVIIVHGYGYNRVGSLKYVQLFLQRGFHVFIYDHGNSGESGGNLTTMGYREKDDLKGMADAVQARLGENVKIGTHGESMGAATVLLHAAMDPRVQFVVADCPYADLKEQLKYRLGVEYGLPSFPVLDAASAVTRLQAGFLFRDISPIQAIREKDGLPEIPMLFIHGLADDYIPPQASEKLHAVKQGVSRLHLMPDAKHADSIRAHADEYKRVVDSFLDEIGA